MDQQLPTQLLPAVPHFAFSIFNVSVPNLIMWGVAVVLFFVGVYLWLPRWFERPERGKPSDTPEGGEQA
jgi:heme/copper-type cytochrome/quinol oxidase subunit 1